MNKNDNKTYQFYTDNRSICECGHSLLVSNKYGRLICNHCGRMVFATNKRGKKAKFKYLLEKELKK